MGSGEEVVVPAVADIAEERPDLVHCELCRAAEAVVGVPDRDLAIRLLRQFGAVPVRAGSLRLAPDDAVRAGELEAIRTGCADDIRAVGHVVLLGLLPPWKLPSL